MTIPQVTSIKGSQMPRSYVHMAGKEWAQLEFIILTAFFVKHYFLQIKKERLKLIMMTRLIEQLLVMPSLYTNIKGFCCIKASMKRQTF